MTVFKLRDAMSFMAFGVIIAVVMVYFASLGLRVTPPSDRTTLSMDVPEINGLVVGSNVLIRGVPVGKVTSTTTSIGAANVGFYVDGRFPIPVDTEVRLENLSALGETYIELRPRNSGGELLHDNQRIATESVVQPPSISELATSVVRVLHQLDPDALSRIINEADTALPDPARVLPNLARTSTTFNTMLNSLNGEGRALLSNFQTLLVNSEWVSRDIAAIVPDLNTFGIYGQDFFKHLPLLFGRDAPQKIRNLNNLVARLQSFLDDRGGDLKILGEAMQPKLNEIAGVLMNFDSGQILDHFLQQVPAEGAITLRVRP